MRIKEGFTVTQDESGIYIARSDNYPNPIQMGLSAACLWDMLEKGNCTKGQLISRLDKLYEFGPSYEQLDADVDVFLDFLRSMDLLIE